MTTDSFMVNVQLFSFWPAIHFVGLQNLVDLAFPMTPQRSDLLIVVLQIRASQRFRHIPLCFSSNSTNKMLISLLKGWGEVPLSRDYQNWI